MDFLITILFRLQAKLHVAQFRPQSVLTAKIASKLAAILGNILSWAHSYTKQKQDPVQKKAFIVMCTFEGNAWVDEAISSVFACKNQNWHLFIVDDGSTDGTVDKIKAWKEKHPARISTLLLRSNTYPESTINHGIAEFLINPAYDALTILDQDDVLVPEFIDIGLGAMNERAKVVRCLNERYNKHLTELLYRYVATSQLFISRDVIERVGLRKTCSPKKPADEDYLNRIMIDALAHGHVVVQARQVCQKMRIHGGNAMLKQETKRAAKLKKWLSSNAP